MKRPYSAVTLEEVMQMVPAKRLTPWTIQAAPRAPSATLSENLRRLRAFDLRSTEVAKTLLIDALLAEIVPDYAHLKVWKGMPLDTETLTGATDYLIAPDFAYLSTPLLCVVEAKRDDFLQGRTQCIAEMLACRWQNQEKGHPTNVYGVVSNGQMWQFFQLTTANEVLETEEYGISSLPDLLGALDAVCAACARALEDLVAVGAAS